MNNWPAPDLRDYWVFLDKPVREDDGKIHKNTYWPPFRPWGSESPVAILSDRGEDTESHWWVPGMPLVADGAK